MKKMNKVLIGHQIEQFKLHCLKLWFVGDWQQLIKIRIYLITSFMIVDLFIGLRNKFVNFGIFGNLHNLINQLGIIQFTQLLV